jgi:hypothetical protein
VGVPATAKEGFWHWAAPRWYDIWDHDAVWERGQTLWMKLPDDDGIADSGVHGAISVGYDGHTALKVKGMCACSLEGGCSPNGSAQGDPIANTWIASGDFTGREAGTVTLALFGLPPGEYWLTSYHNFWFPSGHDTCTESTPSAQQALMPSVTVMALAEAETLFTPGGEVARHWIWQDLGHFRYSGDLGCGDVNMIEGSYNVMPSSTLNDAEVTTSLVKFTTDGSAVLVVYQAPDYEDPSQYMGGRACLNAFELEIAQSLLGAGPISPCEGTDDADPDASLRWWPSEGSDSYDVYFGTNSYFVGAADTGSAEYMGTVPSGSERFDPDESLGLNTTYYWRIDHTRGDVTKAGPVWSFTVRACEQLDDFTLWPWTGFLKWQGAGGAEGYVFLERVPECVADPASFGKEEPGECPLAIELEFLNGLLYTYSETVRTFYTPKDWIATKTEAISFYFRGNAGNQPGQMYIAVEDAGGGTAQIYYDGDQNDLKIEQWQGWGARLSQLEGIDLTQVKKIIIGIGDRTGSSSVMASGRILIDRVSLCRLQCLEGSAALAKDHNGDCVVNFADHAMEPAVTSGNMQQYRDFAAAWLEDTLWP